MGVLEKGGRVGYITGNLLRDSKGRKKSYLYSKEDTSCYTHVSKMNSN